MNITEIPAVVMTHAGRFHADDVFSSALLRILRPDVKILRTFQVPKGFDGLVYDIGGGKFDHHQQDAEIRENGVPYAAFGLLWREFGQQLLSRGEYPELSAEETSRFDEKFVQSLDEDDNKGTGSSIAGVIGMFNPSWDSKESPDSCFEKAVSFALIILNNRINNIYSIQRARQLVETALESSEDNIVILSRYAPWKMVLSGSGTEFVIFPSQRGGYCAQIVPQEVDGGDSKYRFPEVWAGKPAGELPQLSGIDTLSFCHNGRFLISTATVEDAIKACRIAREIAKKEQYSKEIE